MNRTISPMYLLLALAAGILGTLLTLANSKPVDIPRAKAPSEPVVVADPVPAQESPVAAEVEVESSQSLSDGDGSIPARVPWTTSRIVGSPEPPPPYRNERAFPNLQF